MKLILTCKGCEQMFCASVDTAKGSVVYVVDRCDFCGYPSGCGHEVFPRSPKDKGEKPPKLEEDPI